MSIPTEKRIAVVTGGNKGIGREVCRQLAGRGVFVILTARDEKKGIQAVEELREESGLSDVIFHQLDVTDLSSIASLAEFIKARFGKLDILVNNAGISGVTIDSEISKKYESGFDTLNTLLKHMQQNYEKAEECFKTNYYGTKDVTEALIPLILLSTSGRIVNVSSKAGKLEIIPNERIKQDLCEAGGLTEEKIDAYAKQFLKDFKAGLLVANGWPSTLSAYCVSKVLLNAYTRVLAKRHPTICINCVHPGFVKTDINYNSGNMSVDEGARGVVMLALLPDGSPSGLYFDITEVSTF